jgi:hypothetical protein
MSRVFHGTVRHSMQETYRRIELALSGYLLSSRVRRKSARRASFHLQLRNGDATTLLVLRLTALESGTLVRCTRLLPTFRRWFFRLFFGALFAFLVVPLLGIALEPKSARHLDVKGMGTFYAIVVGTGAFAWLMKAFHLYEEGRRLPDLRRTLEVALV